MFNHGPPPGVYGGMMEYAALIRPPTTFGYSPGSFEPDWRVPSFWAASVIEVTEPGSP